MSAPAGTNRFAVVGIGCRFPGGASTPDAFWNLLSTGTDAITEVPGERFDLASVYDADPGRPGKLYTRWGGFVDAIDGFDAEFFGISPREAARMDPQQRLLLEVVWEALEDGGLAAEALAGSRTGVFIGLSTHDYYDLQINPANRHLLDAHSGTGTAQSIAANRISYAYDLRGPSLVVDTACSSSLTAVHLACRSLKDGECDVAIAGGVNVFLTPDIAVAYCRASMLSPDGRCKAFDAAANGFVRGEGAGAVLLKRLDRALADADRIYAVVRGSAVNQDGRTVGLTVPSAEAQEALIREALRDAGLPPSAVQYVEAHGTGTRVGDPIEASGIGRVLSGNGRETPCVIGSVKTNIGHLEAAAGIAGFIKTALALEHRAIPPSLHFRTPNPGIPLEALQLRVPTALEPWPANGHPRVAGVNSFGFGGANAHVVLEEPPPARTEPARDEGRVHLLPLSARHPAALRQLAREHRDLLAAPAAPPLHDVCYSAAVHRGHHAHRVAFVGATRAEMVDHIDTLLASDEGSHASAARPGRAREPKLAMVFTGMGPQWWGMGRQLLRDEPVFREALEECDRRFRDIGSWALLDALAADEGTSRVHEPEQATVTNLAIQVGLTQLWRSWGIVPDAIVGHSAGEMAASWAAGALSLDDALLVAFHRGILQHRARGSGTMLSAGTTEADAAALIAPVGDRVSIAAINSPRSVTLSGPREALETVAATLERQGLFNRFLQVDVAYHSPAMDLLRDEFLAAVRGLAPRTPAVPLVSTVSGAWADEPWDAAYWFDNLRQPVRFADAVDRLAADEFDVFLEIGPHPVLAVSIGECLASRQKHATVLPSLRRKDDERKSLLRSLASLYVAGRRVAWSGVCPQGALVALPHYPWQRERQWFDGIAATQAGPTGTPSGHALLGYRLRSVRPNWETPLGDASLDYLEDHRLQERPVFPAAAYVEMALAAATPEPGPAVLEHLAFHKALFLSQRRETMVQLHLDSTGAAFEIHSSTHGSPSWMQHATGRLRAATDHAAAASSSVDLAAIRQRCVTAVAREDVYRQLDVAGLCYHGAFRGIQELWRGEREALARIAIPDGGGADLAQYRVHPALLDAAFQATLAAAGGGDADTGLCLPVSIERVRFMQRPGATCWSHARVTSEDRRGLTADITLLTDRGDVAVEVQGLHCRTVEEAARSRRGPRQAPSYLLEWEPQALARRTPDATSPVRSADEVATRLQPIAARLAGETRGIESFRRVEPFMTAIVAHFARAAFIALGWDRRAPLPTDPEPFARALGVVPQHHRLLRRLIEIVDTAGPLPAAGSAAHERSMAAELCERVLADMPEDHPAIDLMRRSGERLDEILNGTLDPRQVLFAPAAMPAWAQFFTDLPWYAYYNTLMAEAVAAAIENVSPGHKLRILEIGAGSGGTTRSILPRVQGRVAEYCFTDVSTLFLAQARERFRHDPSVRVTTLDIERDPVAQVGAGRFDLVLAANVVHATVDLRTSLAHIKRLLAPGGLLLLLEGTRKMPFADSIFGITDGWWRFADVDLRPDYPLLDPARWRNLLAEAGFAVAPVVSEPMPRDEPPPQCVIAATLPVGEPGVADVPLARPAKSWLVFADQGVVAAAIVDALRARGDRCVRVASGREYVRHDDATFTTAADDPAHIVRLLEYLSSTGPPVDGVIHAWSLDACPPAELDARRVLQSQHDSCGSLVALVQAYATLRQPLPQISIVTAGAQAVRSDADGPNVAQAPVWGLARVLASEYPGTRCCVVDLGAHADADDIRAFLEELDAGEVEEEVAVRAGDRYVTRLRPADLHGTVGPRQKHARSPERDAFHLDIDTPGTLETLTLRATPERHLGPGEIRVRVLAAGVNFRDVMLALGMLPPMSIPGREGRTALGFECAGIVEECGEGVTALRPGDEVMAVALGAFGSRAVTRAELTVRKPRHLAFEQAAAIPLAFVTAHYGLNTLAAIRPGERVLIHAATGGVGLAAVQIARRAGAQVFATAGSPEKRAHLQALGIEHVMDSRSLAFADEVLAATGGEGVDVILNSLSGEAIAKGLSILRPYGRFIELGKRDIHANTPLGLLPFDKNLMFASVALDRMCLDRPAAVGAMLAEVVKAIDNGQLDPLPHTAFDLADAEPALRCLAQARHMGKLVLTVQAPSYAVAPLEGRAIVRDDGTYFITGGLGGFGLAIARWLVDKGARHVVLMSRSGTALAENAAALDELRQSPAHIAIVTGDVGETADVERALDRIRATMPPLRGLVHGAMVLEDALMQQLTPGQLDLVAVPKACGAWNLHKLTTGDPLDFFVMCSSVSAVFGSRGQGSYAAANLFLDALAPYRRALGLPALTVNLGALSEVGYVSRHPAIAQHLERLGLNPFTATDALGWIEDALRLGFGNVVLAQIDWPRWSQNDPASSAVKATKRLAHLVPQQGSTPGEAATESSPMLAQLAGAPVAERRPLLERCVLERIARVLGTTTAKVDPDRPLTEIGVDSLMSVELQTMFDRDFGTSLPLAAFLEGATPRQLSTTLLEQLRLGGPADAAPSASPPVVETLPARADAGSASVPPSSAAPGHGRSAHDPPQAMPAASTQAPPDAGSARDDADLARPSRRSRVDYVTLDYRRWPPLLASSRRAIAALFPLIAKVEVHGLDNIPRSGPVLVVANHLSMLDVPVLLTVLPRRAVCFANERLREFPWIRWFLNLGDTIYVRRGEADVEALADGLAVLRGGGILGIAPEGTRSRTGGLVRGQHGAAYLAAEAPAPVLPIAMYGQEQFTDNLKRMRRTHVHVAVGRAIAIEPGAKSPAALQADTQRLMSAIAALLPVEYRGVYSQSAESVKAQVS